jgi:hypothetical protein
VGRRAAAGAGDDDDDLDATDSSAAAAASDGTTGTAGAAAAAALQRAKTKALKKLSLQHLVGHVLPVVSALKKVLGTCSPRPPLFLQVCTTIHTSK